MTGFFHYIFPLPARLSLLRETHLLQLRKNGARPAQYHRCWKAAKPLTDLTSISIGKVRKIALDFKSTTKIKGKLLCKFFQLFLTAFFPSWTYISKTATTKSTRALNILFSPYIENRFYSHLIYPDYHFLSGAVIGEANR
jgi:hypothetical protein